MSCSLSKLIINKENQFVLFLGDISWSAIIFLLFVCFILVIIIILILYFEKVCCFARYRFLKYFLRRITRTKKTQSPVTTTTQILANTPLTKIEEQTELSSTIPEFFYIAGQREDRRNFLDTTPMLFNESSKRIDWKEKFFIICLNSSSSSY